MNWKKPLQKLDKVSRSIAQAIIRAYQTAGSPILGGACRFYPTCSHYGMEAYRTHTFITATKLTLLRVWKCRPFGSSGFDPIPGEQHE